MTVSLASSFAWGCDCLRSGRKAVWMLTVAYCRVSTEEQAEEGYSIDGQADKLRVYAQLHDLGDAVVVADPGRSGKDMDRPGLQQILAMVEQGHVANVLVWRLDRLSRNLGDLILLADQFGQRGVALHSFTERIDLSSATGRMFYNVLGSFAQFYREQLAENVKLGLHQAARQGRWVNRPKTGYDLIGGRLVPNAMAPVVRRIFHLRARGRSFQQIENETGVKFSTVRLILMSRIYLGEVTLNGEWFPGEHEAIITAEEFDAAQRAFSPRRGRRSREVLAGRVRCGLCRRVAAVEYRQNGQPVFRCRHRGTGCDMPRRPARALEMAMLIGMRVLRSDEDLRAAIRRELDAGRAHAPQGRARTRDESRMDADVGTLEDQRRKLLALYYADQIGADLFAEEEAKLRSSIELRLSISQEAVEAEHQADDLAQRFEAVAQVLASLDIESVWAEADQEERKVLVDELLEEVALFPDHLEVAIAGSPRLNVLLEEVGVQFCGVGGGT
ncbi:MAG TPA: recombinase family protein [Mycobacteriales bacterium]|nr:recombinase family protein [Mycobacteriales bacterium]